MALMNDDDDDWDLDEDNVPAPMDSAKARLNQTTAVFAGKITLLIFIRLNNIPIS